MFAGSYQKASPGAEKEGSVGENMAFTLIIPKPLLINYAGFSPKFETVP
jgi:hypothetical protein